MRILLITPFFPPQSTIASMRTLPFATVWAGAGQEVTVLTTVKRDDQRGLDLPADGVNVVEIAYRAPRLFERLRRDHKAHASHAQPRRADLLNILRRIKTTTGVFSAVRMPDLTDYWVKPAFVWCHWYGQRPWDVVVSSSGPYTAHLLAMKIKRAGLAQRWVADFRDLWTDNHLYRGLFPFTIRERLLERQCLRETDLLVTVSDGFAEMLRRKSGKPVEVIYNGFDPSAIDSISSQRIFSGDDRVRLVYTGTLYPQGQDAALVVRAMAGLARQRPDVAARLLLVVAGQGCETWTQLAQRHGVAAMVESRGIVDRTDALRMQRDAQALLVLDWKDPTKGWLAAKVFEYLAADPPILAIGGSESSALGDLIHRAGRGVHLGSNQGRVAQTLLDLVQQPSRVNFQRDSHFIASLTRENQSMRLLECMRRLHSFQRA